MEMMKRKVKTAVIGYGHLGKWHCEKTHSLESAELTYIVDHHDLRLLAAQENFPHVKVTTNLDEAIKEVEAFLIVTPTSTHHELLKTLLPTGKHIFCEKPLCSNWREVLDLEQFPLQKGQVVQVGHSERFQQVWEVVKMRKEFSLLPSMVHIDRLGPYKGRATDVDVVNDLMIHDIDLLIHLFGETPSSVSSFGQKVITDKWDYVSSTFHFPSGRKAMVTVYRNDLKDVRQFKVINPHGTFLIDLFSQEWFEVRKGHIERRELVKSDVLLLEQQAFFQSILEGSPVPVSFEEGKLAVKIVEKVLESLDTQRTVTIS